MSVSSMTNVAVARRDDELGRKDDAGDAVVPNTMTALAAATGGTPETETTASATLKSVATHIPTEVIGLYLAGSGRAGGKPTPVKPRTWPTWEMAAASVGFTAWAFSLPDSPFARFSWYNLSWATFVVLAVTTGLGLVGPVMQRTLRS